MNEEAYQDDIVVSADGITVKKAFKTDEFAVPTVKFTLTSELEEPATVRLSESIPDEFSMDGIGFHPEYESENWTAFEDHTVEFERELDAGAEFVTVYGVRIDSPEQASQFMTEPTISSVDPTDGSEEAEPEDAADDAPIDDIASEESSQAVKDMISGDSETVPGLEDEGDTDSAETPDEESEEVDEDGLDLGLDDVDLEPDDSADEDTEDEDVPDIDLGIEEGVPEPDEAGEDAEEDGLDIDLDPDEEPDDETEEEIDLDEEPETEPDEETDLDEDLDEEPDDGPEEEIDLDEELEAESDENIDATSEADIDSEPGEQVEAGGVASALAAELRAGNVDEADKQLLREELDLSDDEPESDSRVDARIDHLQSRVEEVAAYTGALETFLEENGRGEELIEEFEADVESLRSDLDNVDNAVTANAESIDRFDERLDERAAEIEQRFDDRIDDAEATVAGAEERIGDVTDDLDSVGSDVETIRGELDEFAERLDAVEGTADDAADDLEELFETLDDLDEHLEHVAGTVDHVEGDVEEIQEWRNQLGEMFS